MNGIAFLKACDNKIYSASAVLSDISVCNFDFHNTGHPAYFITYTLLERTLLVFSEPPEFQAPTNLANPAYS